MAARLPAYALAGLDLITGGAGGAARTWINEGQARPHGVLPPLKTETCR